MGPNKILRMRLKRKEAIIGFGFGLMVAGMISNLRLHCGKDATPIYSSTRTRMRTKALLPRNVENHPPPCRLNPYLGAIEPLNVVTKRMDLWMSNISNAYERSYL